MAGETGFDPSAGSNLTSAIVNAVAERLGQFGLLLCLRRRCGPNPSLRPRVFGWVSKFSSHNDVEVAEATLCSCEVLETLRHGPDWALRALS